MTGLILCQNAKGVIAGPDGRLPWKCSNDMQHFVRVSMNYGNLVMGRKTYEVCGPLPRRVNYVLTRDPNFGLRNHQIITVHDKSEITCDPLLVIGGREIYREYLQAGLVDEIYLTIVDDISEGIRFDISPYLVNFDPITISPYPDCRIIHYLKHGVVLDDGY